MVEIPAYITKDGPEPVRVGEIPRFYKGLIEQQDACEGLVVEAVIEGSYKKALQAFTLNRTIPSANVAKEILDEMIEANKRILGGIEIKFQKFQKFFMILKLFWEKISASTKSIVRKRLTLI